ncbi:DUF397 domain-containing protein [Streptomyces sp. NBC_01429]|uniref:DUF397 domain-containing protein n=1 Tax=Streptomyces sp. NBC_01429 TaxID=2903862 RepID=UPI002E2B1F14|nr:DUF397 domain-containing protein [Streptomyces sp. NBC_01429]
MTGAEWFKSSYSNAQGGQCVEGARLGDGAIAVRDSTRPQGPAFVFPAPAWTAFAGALGAIDALANEPRP